MTKLFRQLLIAFMLVFTALAVHAQAIDINTATAKDLKALKGVGSKKAEAIVKYRDEHGPFQSVDELRKVKGIGPKILSDNKDKLTVGKTAVPTAPTTPPAMGTTPPAVPKPPGMGTTPPPAVPTKPPTMGTKP
jgi:competence protein ComEA